MNSLVINLPMTTVDTVVPVEPRFAGTRLIRQTPRYYGQFSLPPGKALAFSLN